MRKSIISAEFQSNIRTVWNIITDNNNYAWRSDLEKIEIIGNGNEFVEYTKGGFSTKFTITAKEELKRYEFNMENKNMTGHWIGCFEETNKGGTKIVFSEEININNPVMEFLSYLFMNIKKMQKTYVDDLRKELGENC
jgi:hypothetical protein